MNTFSEAIKEIQNNYDAFYILNKYGGNGTHKQEFDILYEFVGDDEMGKKALNWIKNCYDCYCKEKYINDKDSAFAYLEKLIVEIIS